MMMTDAQREKMVALMVLANGADESVLDYADGSEKRCFEELCVEVENRGGDVEAFVDESIQTLRAAESFTSIPDIHPAWILDAFQNESHRVIGVLLRYLPSRHVRYVLDHLPKRIKERLPHVMDAFSVQTPILEIVKRRFLSQFLPTRDASAIDAMSVDTIDCLKSDDLIALLRDLGIQEVAMALSGLDEAALKALFSRLEASESRALRQRMLVVEKVSPDLIKEAKYNLLEIPMSASDTNRFLVEIGVAGLAKALKVGDDILVRRIRQKLDPEMGYLLQRYFSLHVTENNPVSAEERRQMILARIYTLSKDGAISKEWSVHFVPEHDNDEIGNHPQM